MIHSFEIIKKMDRKEKDETKNLYLTNQKLNTKSLEVIIK